MNGASLGRIDGTPVKVHRSVLVIVVLLAVLLAQSVLPAAAGGDTGPAY